MTDRRPGVTLLTGFLGSGKTTLVNRLLAEQTSKRIAVVVNEFGQLGIDKQLIAAADEDVMELANGCVCCASRGDLSRAVDSILRMSRRPDHILIEGSGLADPGPVVEMFASPPWSDTVDVCGTVTVVDAANFDENLDRAEAAYNQLSLGDLLLVNKVDLVTEQTVALIEDSLRMLNGDAVVVRTQGCSVPSELVFTAPRLTHAARAAGATHAPHDSTSVAVHAGEVERQLLETWLEGLPPEVWRAKGIVRLVGQDTPQVLQLVSRRYEIAPIPQEGAVTSSTVVLIGSKLDQRTLLKGFAACQPA